MPAGRPQTLKARCSIDLGFPFHRTESPAERMRAIAEEIEASGDEWEIYASGPYAEALEARIAALTGKPAALWLPTGTMAQGIAARIHCDAAGRNELALHPTSHLILHEQDSAVHVHGLKPRMIGEWNSALKAGDIPASAGCAIIELAQRQNGGLLPEWDVLEALKARAAELGVALHMDGARLWALPGAYEGRSHAQICDGFSSVYVSLYKDLGAISGAVLAGDEDFIEAARIWRARMGGTLPIALPNMADALARLDALLAEMPAYIARAGELASAINAINGLTVSAPKTNLFHIEVNASIDRINQARDHVAQTQGIWLFSRCWDYPEQACPAIEMTVGGKMLDIDPKLIIDGYSLFAETLGEV